tara:strand:+ start:838 stop:1542 length:705 start_codon:yes stop_codon:yes gene_type:complete
MKFNNYKEPPSYTYLKKKLDISTDEFYKSFKIQNIDAHSQIIEANLYASRLNFFINDFLKKNYVSFLDCGCGLGFIARELIKLSPLSIHYCDPSISIKEIHTKIFPQENFFQSDIENIKNYGKKFDLIYLREVYPFTRDSSYQNQNKLIKILNNQLNNNGILIFEQIKNKEDLFDNLSKLRLNHKIIPLLPVKAGKKRFLNNIFFKSFFLQILLKIIYKIFNKDINYFILINKF